MTKRKISQFLDFLYRILGSTKTFIFAIILLVINSLWLALSAIYPLPFDEYYHIGIIKIYTQQWSPFIASQSEAASLYGDITRMPSYLYHYLMSFPYRFLDIFIDNEIALIILMRLVNIALVVGALLLFRELFTRAGISKRIINVAVLFFVITPIVPFLAAHVNYDNLMLFLMPIFFLYFLKLQKESELQLINSVYLILLGALIVLVKNTFLPIYAFTILWVLMLLLIRRRQLNFSKVKSYFVEQTLIKKVVIICAVILIPFLFAERYGLNYIKYSSIRPPCEKVQSVEICKQYSPWYRTYQTKNRRETTGGSYLYGNPISFTQHWLSVVMRGYFAIFSHTPTVLEKWYEPYGSIVTRPLMPIQISLAYVILPVGFMAIIYSLRSIIKNPLLIYILLITAMCFGSLWLFNFKSYLGLGEAQTIQARYSYGVLLPFFILLAWSANAIIKKTNYKLPIFLVVFLLYAWGGGIAGWVIRSDSLWYWQSPTVIKVNQSAQNVLKWVVPH